LKDWAAAKEVVLTLVDLDPSLPREDINLQPDVQRLNLHFGIR